MSRARQSESLWPAAALLALTCLAAASCSGRVSGRPDARPADDEGAAARTDGAPREEHPPLYAVVVGGKTGFIDRAGRLVIRPQFDPTSFHHGREFSDGMARVTFARRPADPAGFCLTERYGYIDATGRLSIPAQYDEAEQFSEGLAAVRVSAKEDCVRTDEDRYGYIDKAGRLAIPARYYSAGSFSEGLAGACEAGWCGYIDRTGRRIIDAPSGLAPLGRFSEGMARVGDDKGRHGFIDRAGKVVIPPRFYRAEDFSEGLALVVVDGKKGFIDRAGRAVVEPVYDVAYPFRDGLARVTVGGRNGYIDRTGKTVAAPQYADAGDFSGGLAPVLLGRKWGYIDKSGRVAIEPRFDRAAEFVGDLALVSVGWADADVPQNGVMNGYIDRTGNYVWKPSR